MRLGFAIKLNPLHRNGASPIVMRGVQKCTGAGASLRDRNVQPLCCINLDTVTEIILPSLIQRTGIIKKCAFAV